MAAAAIVDFQNLKFSTFVTVRKAELHHRAKFRFTSFEPLTAAREYFPVDV